MENEWEEIMLEKKIAINTKRNLPRGIDSIYVSMQDLDVGNRKIQSFDYRKYNGSGSKFKNGDTILARITPCLENGKTAYVNILEDDEIAHGSTEFIVLSGINGLSDNLFVYYLSRSPEFRAYAISQMEGSSGRQRVPAITLERFKIRIPQINEQRAIVHILGTLDDKIELNRQMNETLDGMARAIFKSWFVDFDPVRAKAEGRDTGLPDHIANLFPASLQDSEMGQIPKGWQIKPLKHLAYLKMKTIHPMNNPEKEWEHFSIPAYDENKMPKIERGKEIKSGKYIVPSDSILISKLNPRFPRVWLPDIDSLHSAICSSEFIPLVPKNIIYKPYLFEMLKSKIVQEEIILRTTGSTGSRQRVKPKEIESIPIIYPSETIIIYFSEKVIEIHKKLLLNNRESRILSKLRDTLLPKLISGEIRVPLDLLEKNSEKENR